MARRTRSSPRRRPTTRPARRRSRRSLFARRLLVLVPVLLVLAVLVGWLVDGVLWGSDETPRNLTLAGVDVGEMDEDQLRAIVEEMQAQRAGRPVTVSTEQASVQTTAADIGLAIDVDRTVEEALDARDGDPISWVAGFFREPKAELHWRLDRDAASAAVASLASGTSGGAPALTMRDGLLVVVDQGPVLAVDMDRLEEDLLAAAEEPAIEVTAYLVTVDDPDRRGRAQELAELANEITADGIQVRLDGRTERLDAGDLRSLVRLVEREREEDGDTLALALDPVATVDLLRRVFPGTDREGSDVTWVVAFGLAAFEGGEPDVRCCAEGTADELLDALIDGDRSVTLELAETPRERGREWAESLGIKELVGSFTTRFTPGQARVQNIQRIADLTRGVVIEPGETFSVNDFVGPRTREKGFVPAGVIQDGVFTEDVGGGISQYATTLFNAAFFAGLDFGEYRSHSIYIDRYPYGREATLSYPNPDLEIVNNTPYGVLLWPTTTPSSITVELYSTRYAIGDQTGQSEARVGEACVRVTTERTRLFVDGHTEVDTVTALYRPEGVRCDGTSSVPTTAPPAPTQPPPPPATEPPPVTEPPPPATEPPPPTEPAPPTDPAEAPAAA